MDVELRDDLPCHRCLGQLVLMARVPYDLRRADGQVVTGSRGVALCAACDAEDAAAQGVLAHLTFHGRVGDDDEFAMLVDEWTRRAADRLVNETIPEEDWPEGS